MQSKASLTRDKNRLLVSGRLDFSTVAELWKKCLTFFENSNAWSVDFTQVTVADSAALAFLIELIKYAKNQHKQVVLMHLPPPILSLAAVAGVSRIILNPVEDGRS